jgi:hypothetical protein
MHAEKSIMHDSRSDVRQAQDQTYVRSEDGRLFLVKSNGERIDVTAKSCFPWSSDHAYYSIQNADKEEVAFIRDLNELDEASRAAVGETLKESRFVFEITGINSISEEFELRVWNVRTNQGERLFQTKLDSWPVPLGNGSMLLVDLCGDQYLIPEPASLDTESSTRLAPFID